MFVNLQHELMARIRSVEQYMIRLDIAITDSDLNAYSKNVPIIDGVWIRIADFVSCDTGTSAVKVFSVALLLRFYVFEGTGALVFIVHSAFGYLC